MHLVFYARGINHRVEIWKILMQSQFWQWHRKNLDTGEEFNELVQGSLRPSVLGCWEYIFPKECLSEVLAVMGLREPHKKIDKARTFTLRRIMSLKKIPRKNWEEAKIIPVTVALEGTKRGLSSCEVKGVDISVIGIKEDYEGDLDFGKLGKFKQEAL